MTPTAYARKNNRHLSAVQKAITAGFIVRGKDGLIDEEQADRDWLSRGDTRPKSGAVVETKQLNEARVMKEVYAARMAKLDYERETSELVPLAEVNRWISAMILSTRDEFLRIGPELQDELAEEKSPAAISRLIDKRVRRALANLKEYGEELAAAA